VEKVDSDGHACRSKDSEFPQALFEKTTASWLPRVFYYIHTRRLTQTTRSHSCAHIRAGLRAIVQKKWLSALHRKRKCSQDAGWVHGCGQIAGFACGKKGALRDGQDEVSQNLETLHLRVFGDGFQRIGDMRLYTF
jgi:hypothetical protein